MRISRGRGIALGALAAATAAAAPLAIADGVELAKKTPVVKVGDDFFSPEEVRVRTDSKVKFKWLAENSNPHNVTLTKGPKKVKKKDFTSATGSIGVKFNPKFEKKGTYEFICTIHPTVMKMDVIVKK